MITVAEVRKHLFDEKEAREAKKGNEKAAKRSNKSASAKSSKVRATWDDDDWADWVQCDDCNSWLCEDCVKEVDPSFDFKEAAEQQEVEFVCTNCSG